MLRVAEFFKVSPKQFMESIRDVKPSLNDSEILDMHNHVLKLPERATKGSAGYDFVTPFDITLSPGQTAKIPTGIRAKMEPGWVLMIFPRSGLGFNSIRTTKDIFSSRSPTIPRKEKGCSSRQERCSPRAFSFRSVLPWTMNAMGSETAALEVLQNNCRKYSMIII